VSVLGSGSTFTFYLPSQFVPTQQERSRRPALDALTNALPQGTSPEQPMKAGTPEPEPDGAPDSCLLLMADGATELRESVRGSSAQAGFRSFVAEDTRLDLAQISKLRPSGIALDLRSGDLDPWIALDRLKHHSSTSHLPVLALVHPPDRRKAYAMGAAAVTEQAGPAELAGALAELQRFPPNQPRRLLLVDSDPRNLSNLVSLLAGDQLEIRALSSSADAALALSQERFQALVVNLGSRDPNSGDSTGRDPTSAEPNGNVAALPSILALASPELPLIVHAGRPLDETEERQVASARAQLRIEVTRTSEQLLRQTCLLLHRPEDGLTSGQRRQLLDGAQRKASLAGVRVLIIDDDVRNIFAMTSALERHGALVSYADNGKQGLELLNSGTPVQAVLVDIMMPELDGYEVMRRIREQPRHQALPLIAVTAKAMPADREKCIRAGATHYLAKPVDAGQLVSALRVATSE